MDEWESLYRRMRDCAAGYSNCCDEDTGTTRRLDKEFQRVEADARLEQQRRDKLVAEIERLRGVIADMAQR